MRVAELRLALRDICRHRLQRLLLKLLLFTWCRRRFDDHPQFSSGLLLSAQLNDGATITLGLVVVRFNLIFTINEGRQPCTNLSPSVPKEIF